MVVAPLTPSVSITLSSYAHLHRSSMLHLSCEELPIESIFYLPCNTTI